MTTINFEWISALVGGALIGVAVSLMLLTDGRVTGLSGISNGAINPEKGDTAWRWAFVGGLIAGGFVLKALRPESLINELQTSLATIAVAGVLVGFGTIMGSGCTSGHGVCGMSRLSPRSIVSTLAFIAAGILSVAFLRNSGAL